jgi:choline transport protein
MLWTLGRDSATPFPKWVGKVDARWDNPFNATLTCAFLNTLLGIIYIGSSTAFSAFVGSFIVLASLSYLAFIIPNIASRRRYIAPGPFRMPDAIYYPVAGVAVVYMLVWGVVYCFPFARPFDARSMNYTSVLVAGVTGVVGGWYAWVRRRGYEGVKFA